jgi:hypothetical protein
MYRAGLAFEEAALPSVALSLEPGVIEEVGDSLSNFIHKMPE